MTTKFNNVFFMPVIVLHNCVIDVSKLEKIVYNKNLSLK